MEEPRRPHRRKQQAKLSWIAARPTTRSYRAYLLKEQLRQVFAPGGAERIQLLDRWLHWAAPLPHPSPSSTWPAACAATATTSTTPSTHNLCQRPVESVNTKIRLLTRIAYGFNSAEPLIALAMLDLGGHRPALPGRTKHPRISQ